MALVYWIRAPHHKDIMTEGYIGYTGGELIKRLAQHKRAFIRFSTGREAQCKKLYRSVLKLGGFDNVIVETLLVSTPEYCLEIEEKLRPSPNIGWNIRVGGDKHVMHLRTITEETKKKLREVRDTWEMSEETKQRMSSERKGTGNPMYGVRPWQMKFLTELQLETWSEAQTIYSSWAEISGAGLKTMCKNFPNLAKWSIDSMIRKFKEGWVPELDEEWIKFNENYKKYA